MFFHEPAQEDVCIWWNHLGPLGSTSHLYISFIVTLEVVQPENRIHELLRGMESSSAAPNVS